MTALQQHQLRVLVAFAIFLLLILAASCSQLTGVKPRAEKPPCVAGTIQTVVDSTYLDSLGQAHSAGHFHVCGAVSGQPIS